MNFYNPYKQEEKRWSWFISQANLATEWRDQASFFERAWREAESNREYHERRGKRRLAEHWKQRAVQAAGWQIEVEKRFVSPCTCEAIQLPDRVLVAGEDDCPVHGFGETE